MLFTVRTHYKGFDKNYPNLENWSDFQKVEANDREEAKKIAWQNIMNVEDIEAYKIIDQRSWKAKR